MLIARLRPRQNITSLCCDGTDMTQLFVTRRYKILAIPEAMTFMCPVSNASRTQLLAPSETPAVVTPTANFAELRYATVVTPTSTPSSDTQSFEVKMMPLAGDSRGEWRRAALHRQVSVALSTIDILVDSSAASTHAPSLAPSFSHSLGQSRARRSQQRRYDHVPVFQKHNSSRITLR